MARLRKFGSTEKAEKSGRRRVDVVHWDIECRVSSIANDFVNDDLEPVFVIGVDLIQYNPEIYPSGFDTEIPVAYVRLSDSFSHAVISIATAGYLSGQSTVIKFNERVAVTSPENGRLRVTSIQMSNAAQGSN